MSSFSVDLYIVALLGIVALIIAFCATSCVKEVAPGLREANGIQIAPWDTETTTELNEDLDLTDDSTKQVVTSQVAGSNSTITNETHQETTTTVGDPWPARLLILLQIIREIFLGGLGYLLFRGVRLRFSRADDSSTRTHAHARG